MTAPPAHLRWRIGLGGVWGLLLGLLTVGPGTLEHADLASFDLWCLICGTRGSADAILNVAFFVPLGLALGGRSGPTRALIAGLAVSVAVELVQTSIPGRHAGVADILWNSSGALAGALLYGEVSRRLAARARTGAIHWGVLAGSILILAGILLRPSPPEADYWALWTPALPSMDRYEGTVLSATFDGVRLDPGRPTLDDIRARLQHGEWSLATTLAVGSPPRALSPLILIGDRDAEIVLLGAHRDALLFRERTLATLLRFDAPDYRLEGAFAGYAPGDTARVGLSKSSGRACLRSGARERCGLGSTPGRTWGLLLYVEGPREWHRRVVDFLWMAALFFPIGLFARSRRDGLRGAALAGVLGAAAVLLTPLVVPAWFEPLGAALGLLVGSAATRLLSSLAHAADHQPRTEG